MEGYGPATYGDRIADVYDALYEETLDTDGAVETLAELAGDGRVLELAIGTGRLALPLARARPGGARGRRVRAMVAKLRAKPGGDGIPVTMGDFADVPVEGDYGLIFIAVQHAVRAADPGGSAALLRERCRHLTDDGVFVIEAFVPDLARFDRDQRAQATIVEQRPGSARR